MQPKKATTSVLTRPDQKRAEVGAVVGVGDQLLADVIARTLPQEAEVELLPAGLQVLRRCCSDSQATAKANRTSTTIWIV